MSNDSEINFAISKEAERIEEDSIHSAKSHFNAGVTWKHRHYWLGVPATILGALAGASIVKGCPELAGLFSLVATILTALVTFLKPSDWAATHKAAGDQYLALRNDARLFHEIEILEPEDTCTHADKLRVLSDRRNELNQSSPEIPRSAFKKARDGIDKGESLYRNDQEKK